MTMTLNDRRDAAATIFIGSTVLAALAAWLASGHEHSPINSMTILLLATAIAAAAGWVMITRSLAVWWAQWQRTRAIARRYRRIRRKLSITCGCGALARPISGTEDRYCCGHCGNQWASSPHRLPKLRAYLIDPQTPWPM
jgi:ABC-type multidrug transport system fused ATPase/permease subunit